MELLAAALPLQQAEPGGCREGGRARHSRLALHLHEAISSDALNIMPQGRVPDVGSRDINAPACRSGWKGRRTCW